MREHEYGLGTRAFTLDEFASADAADFLPAPPDALPADQLEELEAAGNLGVGVRQWVRVARRPNALERQAMGRLVVPREEWVELDRSRHPVVQFFLSLLPWVVVTRRERAR